MNACAGEGGELCVEAMERDIIILYEREEENRRKGVGKKKKFGKIKCKCVEQRVFFLARENAFTKKKKKKKKQKKERKEGEKIQFPDQIYKEDNREGNSSLLNGTASFSYPVPILTPPWQD